MKKYDEYKDSGVAWIGEVPKHWEIRKIKTLSAVKRGASPRPIDDPKYFAEDGEFSWVRIADVSASDKYLTTTTQKLSKLGSSLSVKRLPGDIFISIAGTVGKPIISSIKCCIHDGFVYFPYLKNMNTEFLYYIFMSGQPYLGLGKMGTQLNLNTETIGNIDIPYPPITEQTAIATYLDTHCAKIDNLISIQQKRIVLLQELKQSVITHAVTKGLNPNVEMKQSGVEWIGDVPKHWEVRKIKQCCNKEQYSIKTGPFGSQLKGEELMSQGDVSVYSQQNVINNDFNKIRYFVSNKKAKSLSSFYTRANDVLITSRGTIGKAAILQPIYPKGILHPCLIAIRLDQEICLPEWLTMYINQTDCFKTDISVSSNATTIDVIYTGTLKEIYIPLPTISEQAAIASYLDHKCATIDTSISNAQHQIELLQEYKQSLITEVVTGKRKVTEN